MKYTKRLFVVFGIAFSLALGALLVLNAPSLQAEQPPATPTPGTTSTLPLATELGEGPWVVKVYYADQNALNRLAARQEPWEVNKKEGYAVIEVLDFFEYLNLQNQGYRLEVDQKLTEAMNRPRTYAPGQTSGIPGYACYRTVEETFTSAQSITIQYPNLAEWIDAGDSWEKTAPGGNAGYDMMVLRLTNEQITVPKPKIFIMSAVHAREYTPAELNTRFAEYLVSNYGVDPDITWLLDYNEFHLMLHANPDGRKHAEGGAWWRKNTNENYCSPTSSNRGADLNRNFPFQWGCCGGSSGDECDTTYRGPSATSEPEAQAVVNYVGSIFPDLRPPNLTTAAPITTSGIFLDIHSYSELVLWPWGFTSTDAPNGTQLQTLGRKFAYFNNYTPEQAMSLYATDGTTDDFGYGELGLPAYTFELGTAFFQDCAAFENTILPDNLNALVYAGKAARRPYQTPAGPDALNVRLSTAGVAAGQAVTLTATLNDTRYNNSNGTEAAQNIAAAVYYIDTPHWMTNATVVTRTMQPADGNFNSSVEDAAAVIDTTGLSAGRHTVFVRGQDANGNWGVYSAVFLYIVQPGVSPVINGYVRGYGSHAPLAAVITAENFSAYANPATGYYSMTVVSDTYNISAIAPGYAISTVTNIPARDYQTVQQNFYLFPVCNIFTDDIESGNTGWTAEGNWAISTESSHSPAHAWSDSPGGNYGNDWNYSLNSPVFDLSGYSNVALSFWHTYNLETDWDYGYLEYSIDGGSVWNQITKYNGVQSAWTQEAIDLPALNGQANVRFRFRLDTDGSIVRDGWHIDDIVLSGGGAGCITDFPPTAQFTSNSPVGLGMPMRFSNLSVGSPVPTYTWSFGDGVGSSTETNPVYTYTSVGTYTVVLTAVNSQGSDSVSHTVVVESPVYQVALKALPSAQTGATGQQVQYTLLITNQGNVMDAFNINLSAQNWTSTLSLSGTLGLTQTETVAPGEAAYGLLRVTIPLTAANAQSDVARVTVTSVGAPGVSAVTPVTTTAQCSAPGITYLNANSPVMLGQSVIFSSAVSSIAPFSYVWNFGGAGTRGGSNAAPTFLYNAPGAYTVTLSVVNTCPATDTQSITVSVKAPQPELAWQPDSFAVSLNAGQTTTRTLILSNTGAAVLSWTLRISPPVGWLGASPLSGTLWLPPGGSMGSGNISGTLAISGSQPVGLRFNAAGLISDTYTTTLQLSGNGGDKTVPVVLTVTDAQRSLVYLPIVMKQ